MDSSEENNKVTSSKVVSSKNHRLYRVSPEDMFSKDEPVDTDLVDLLLDFDALELNEEDVDKEKIIKVYKVITVPWEEYDLGWKIAACQFIYNGVLQAIAHDPAEKLLYGFMGAVVSVPVKSPLERVVVAGWKGLFTNVNLQTKKIVFADMSDQNYGPLNEDDCDIYKCLEWYHYVGTHEGILGRLITHSEPIENLLSPQ